MKKAFALAMILVLAISGIANAARQTYQLEITNLSSTEVSLLITRSLLDNDPVAWGEITCDTTSLESKPVIWDMWNSYTGTLILPVSGKECTVWITTQPWKKPTKNDPSITFFVPQILELASISKPITGTIELVPGQTPHYQKTVWFNWSVDGQLKGYQYPMIYVRCEQKANLNAYDEQGGVYGMLERPFASPFEAYKLGGGSSVWVESGGGPAHCIAHIMIYPGLHSGPILDLNTVEFEAGG